MKTTMRMIDQKRYALTLDYQNNQHSELLEYSLSNQGLQAILAEHSFLEIENMTVIIKIINMNCGNFNFTIDHDVMCKHSFWLRIIEGRCISANFNNIVNIECIDSKLHSMIISSKRNIKRLFITNSELFRVTSHQYINHIHMANSRISLMTCYYICEVDLIKSKINHLFGFVENNKQREIARNDYFAISGRMSKVDDIPSDILYYIASHII